eukprot:TRINITY_DN17488_c0_g1_i1.p2 TRINITY_DN17488_c0_g1~~TRINITY_DN17488_c0_g1_i1.p2  ORF type:complete len:232 (-),score=13.10 TRINITY_DN17488_c0_g1_i1:10-705(-)
MANFVSKANVVSEITGYVMFKIRHHLFGTEYKQNKKNDPKEMTLAFAVNLNFAQLFSYIRTPQQFQLFIVEVFEAAKTHMVEPMLGLISERVEIISFTTYIIREDGRRLLPSIGQLRNTPITEELRSISKFNFRLDSLLGKAKEVDNFARVKFEISDFFAQQISFLLLPFGVFVKENKLEAQNHIMENVIDKGLHVDLSNLSFIPEQFHYLTLVFVSFKSNTRTSLKSKGC